MSKKLSPLRTIEPTPETLLSIKATIDARIAQIDKEKTNQESFGKYKLVASPYMRRAVYSLSFFLFLFVFHIENPYAITRGIVTSRAALAPHAHARSQITLSALESLTKDESLFSNTHDYNAVTKIVALNQKTLDTLSLRGDGTLYSMDECLSDYTKYFHLLTMLDKKLAIMQNKQDIDSNTVTSMREYIHEALEGAEDRLGSYPEDMEK